jgi:SAM-dependent methyltransferase
MDVLRKGAIPEARKIAAVPSAANEAQRRHWNDEVRFSAWRRREPMTAAVVAVLLEHAGLVSGEKVLDVGSGGGRTTITAARQVGPDAGALGADISEPLVTLARQRAATAGVTNAEFTVADAQVADLAGAAFDAAISQFGVMFFDDTVAAFANIRGHVRPGGRLAFVCWQALADNPWFAGPAVQQFCPPPPDAGPGKNAVGAFTLADPEYTTAVLAEAGWSAVDRTPYRQTVTVGREVLPYDDVYLRYLGVAEDRLAEARAACERHLAPLQRSDGQYAAPLAFQVFTARNLSP